MDKVLTERDERVFIITVNRPEKHNCIDGEVASKLEAAWKEFRDDDELYVAIITGAGDDTFCSGADLGALDTLGPPPGTSAHRIRWLITHGPGNIGYSRGVDIYKPIIGAINGYALAGGLELACMADIRIASENAQFAVANRRWNVPLVDGGTQRLPRIIGMGRALELIITGRFIDAREAHFMGLVNEVVPRGKALERSLELAKQLCQLPQGGMRTDKQAAIMGFGRPLEEGLRIEAELGQAAMQSRDMREGARAFIEKRKPKFVQDA
jgi:enoyl-CoA hydratase